MYLGAKQKTFPAASWTDGYVYLSHGGANINSQVGAVTGEGQTASAARELAGKEFS